MTTHLKAPSGTGFLTLCKNFEPSCQLTDDIEKVNCESCRGLAWWKSKNVLPDSNPVDLNHYTFKTVSSTQVGGDHYTVLDVQPWDAMASWVSPIEFEGFLRCNAIKYLARAGSKGSAVEDYKKARHYLDKLIEVIEA